jgi:hypothetical protein
MNSWKTTACGILAIVVAVGTCLRAMWDSDPATVADWSVVISSVMAGVGLIAARDNSKSSEDVGAK